MKIFKKFNSIRIAKYVKIFFQGSLYVSGIGRLDFNQGVLLMPVNAENHIKNYISQVNKDIKGFAAQPSMAY